MRYTVETVLYKNKLMKLLRIGWIYTLSGDHIKGVIVVDRKEHRDKLLSVEDDVRETNQTRHVTFKELLS